MASRNPVKSRTVKIGHNSNTVLRVPIGNGNLFSKGPARTQRARIRGVTR